MCHQPISRTTSAWAAAISSAVAAGHVLVGSPFKSAQRSASACFCAGWVTGTVFRSVWASQSAKTIASARHNRTLTVGTFSSMTVIVPPPRQRLWPADGDRGIRNSLSAVRVFGLRRMTQDDWPFRHRASTGSQCLSKASSRLAGQKGPRRSCATVAVHTVSAASCSRFFDPRTDRLLGVALVARASRVHQHVRHLGLLEGVALGRVLDEQPQPGLVEEAWVTLSRQIADNKGEKELGGIEQPDVLGIGAVGKVRPQRIEQEIRDWVDRVGAEVDPLRGPPAAVW